MIPNFDAIAFEIEHAADYEKSLTRPIELSCQHNYTDGITYFYVHLGDLELGRYWRNQWFNGWVFQATGVGDGNKHEADTSYEAIALITKSWEGII